MNDKTSFSTSIKNSAFIKNPVLFESIGIAPVVAMAVSVKTAIMLSVISAAELIIIECFASIALKKVKHEYRVLIYALLGVLINVPFWLFFSKFAPNETANVSIFLPIIAVNSLIALHCERVAVRSTLKETFFDAVSATIGYVLIIFIVAILREVLGSGTFYSIKLNLPVQLKGLLLPFGGFLMLGFAAAFFKARIKSRYPEENPEEAFNLSEISQSHREDIKTMLHEDFEPVANEPIKENPIDFFKSVVEKDEQPEEEKHEKRKKIKRAKKEKPVKTEKRKKEKKAVEKSVEAAPIENPRKEKYESEFDDILLDLERSKAPKEEENIDISKDSDGNGGDEA